jgi:hypothetical protein
MRLSIEDDWKPRLGEEKLEGDEYERHGRLLAERLHEANKVAGQEFKSSHETGKRYYDRRQT